jgi:HPt (histidine-containing phosphotransfer) domain-containing protein
VERVEPATNHQTAAENRDATTEWDDSVRDGLPAAGRISAPFERNEALQNVGGSDAILAEMIGLFASECPKQMAAIAAAYESGQPEAVMRAAHTLKGSAALLAAGAATAAAQRIEFLGRDGTLREFPEAWTELQQHIGELLQALNTFENTGK